MKGQTFKSLNRKLVTSVLFAGFCFVGIAAIVQYLLELNRSRDKTELHINQLIDTVKYSAAIAAYSNNRQIAEDVVQGLLRNDFVHQAEITSDQGLKVEKQRGTPSPIKRGIVRKLVSPFDQEVAVGSITVQPERATIMDEAEHNAFFSVLNSLIVILLANMILLLVVRKLFLNPLTLVSNTLHAIGEGKLKRIEELPWNQDDELGRLTSDINGLLNVLDARYDNEKALREKIEHIDKQLRNIFESTSAGLFLLDQEGKLLTCNPTLIKIMGKMGGSAKGILNSDFAQLFFAKPEDARSMLISANQSGDFEAKDLLLSTQAEEEQKWVHCIMSKIIDEAGQPRFEGVVFDISKRRAAETAIRYQAEFDSLTGLLRRNAIEEQLALILMDINDTPVVVMLLDLDGFKEVNDSHGHDAGDEVLVEVANRISRNVRSGDLVARLGGDEFLVVLKKCEPINIELFIAEKIIRAIRQPIALKSHALVTIGVSIGAASNLQHGNGVENLIKTADEAMYSVKRQGKNGLSIKNNDGSITVKLFPPNG